MASFFKHSKNSVVPGKNSVGSKVSKKSRRITRDSPGSSKKETDKNMILFKESKIGMITGMSKTQREKDKEIEREKKLKKQQIIADAKKQGVHAMVKGQYHASKAVEDTQINDSAVGSDSDVGYNSDDGWDIDNLEVHYSGEVKEDLDEVMGPYEPVNITKKKVGQPKHHTHPPSNSPQSLPYPPSNSPQPHPPNDFGRKKRRKTAKKKSKCVRAKRKYRKTRTNYNKTKSKLRKLKGKLRKTKRKSTKRAYQKTRAKYNKTRAKYNKTRTKLSKLKKKVRKTCKR